MTKDGQFYGSSPAASSKTLNDAWEPPSTARHAFPASSSRLSPHADDDQHHEHAAQDFIDSDDDAAHDAAGHTPPPYSAPAVTSPAPVAEKPAGNLGPYTLPNLNYALYVPPSFTLSSDRTKIACHSSALTAHTRLLRDFIREQAALPPKLIVRIQGTEDGHDFDIKLNLMSLLIKSRNGKAEGLNYIKVVDNDEPTYRGSTRQTVEPGGLDMDAWLDMFCRDQAAIKQFIIQREVTNWNSDAIKLWITGLVQMTGFRGNVQITFPTQYSKIVINSPDKVNRFFSNVQSLFTGTTKYAVLKFLWPYADRPVLSSAEERRLAAQPRDCVVQDEADWWADWKDPICAAVIARRNGWISIEDRLEVLMHPGLARSKAMEKQAARGVR